MALPKTESFTGTTGTALATYDANWVINNGGFEIQSNAVASNNASAEGMAHWAGDTFPDNQYAQCVYTAPTGSSSATLGVAVRVASGTTRTAYMLLGRGDFGATDFFLYKYVASAQTSLGSDATQFSANDTMYLSASGTTLIGKYNGTTIFNTTDSAISSGYAGIGADNNSSLTIQIDTWEGGGLATLEQEGFAFGDDDGNEAAHTLGTQDTNYSGALGVKTLRVLLNGTNDYASSAFKLKFQKNGSGGYSTVQTASASSPTLSYGAAGTIAYSTSGGTSVAPGYPSGITSNSALVLIIGQKPSSANGGTVTTPSGWTLQKEISGATDGDTGGYTTTLGADTGNCNIFVYTKDTVSGSESGTLSVTVGTNNVCWGQIIRIQSSDTCTWSYAADGGKDTSAGNVSIATASGMNCTAGDYLIGAMVIPTDVTTPAQFSSEAFSQTGSTFGTMAEISEPDTTTGNDIGGFLFYNNVSSGSGTGVVTMTATAGGTTTNVRGPGIIIRLRATAVTNEVYVSTSANVAAGGEATTARLTAPSGKTTSSFTTGRRWDDENGSDSIDIAADFYTELEWVLTTQSPGANGDYYEFRVYNVDTAIDTYTLTPKWTISSGGGAMSSSGSATATAKTQANTNVALSSSASSTATANTNTTTGSNLSSAAQATGTLSGIAAISAALSASGSATAIDTGSSIAGSNITSAGSATAIDTTASVNGSNLSATGSSAGTDEGSATAMAVMSSSGVSTATLVGSSTSASSGDGDMSSAGAATAVVTGSSTSTAVASSVAVSAATDVGASLNSANLGSSGISSATLVGASVSSSTGDSDMSASGVSTAVMASAAVSAGAAMSAGTSTGTLIALSGSATARRTHSKRGRLLARKKEKQIALDRIDQDARDLQAINKALATLLSKLYEDAA